MEKKETLWPGGPVLYHAGGVFPPSTDSFLLGHFAAVKRGDRVCDLGAGSGLLGLLVWAREPSVTVTAVEWDETACQVCRRMGEENRMPLTVLRADLRCRDELPRMGNFDLVICNPPYYAPGSGAVATARQGAARSEVHASLTDVLSAAAWLLPTGGRLAMVYKPERLADLFCEARNERLEPKRLRLVQQNARAAPSLALIECRRGGKPGLAVESPLLLRDDSGGETEDVRRAYFRDRE